jgi:ATP-dependent Clp protease adaptor protein ClpS
MSVDYAKILQPGSIQPLFKEPTLYNVVMHNDDFTPLEFVVHVLEVFFHMEKIIATKIMEEIHKTGKAICGVYSKDIASTKMVLVMDHARRHEHPLLCSLEAS